MANRCQVTGRVPRSGKHVSFSRTNLFPRRQVFFRKLVSREEDVNEEEKEVF